jgi:integrase
MPIQPETVTLFAESLKSDGKAAQTVKAYSAKARLFAEYVGRREITPELLASYRDHILSLYKTPRSQNGNVSVTNIFLRFIGCGHLIEPVAYDQYKLYSKKAELTPAELQALLACDRPERDLLLAEVIAKTGIRTGELEQLTVEAVTLGKLETVWRDVRHSVIIPARLRERLLAYANDSGITGGTIFMTRTGKPIDNGDAHWILKAIADAAGVERSKVSPISLRQLFAKTYYSKFGDLIGLTELLGIKEMEQAAKYVKDECANIANNLREGSAI